MPPHQLDVAVVGGLESGRCDLPRNVDSARVVALLRRLPEVVVVAHDPLVERFVELRRVAARPEAHRARHVSVDGVASVVRSGPAAGPQPLQVRQNAVRTSRRNDVVASGMELAHQIAVGEVERDASHQLLHHRRVALEKPRVSRVRGGGKLALRRIEHGVGSKRQRIDFHEHLVAPAESDSLVSVERILPVLLAEIDAVVHVAVLFADVLYRRVAAGSSVGDRFETDSERTPLRVLDPHSDHAVRARGEYPALVVVGPDGAFAALEVRHAAIAGRVAPLRQVRRVDDKADRAHERIALEGIAAFVGRLLDDFVPDFLFASGERQLSRPVAVLAELEITW